MQQKKEDRPDELFLNVFILHDKKNHFYPQEPGPSTLCRKYNRRGFVWNRHNNPVKSTMKTKKTEWCAACCQAKARIEEKKSEDHPFEEQMIKREVYNFLLTRAIEGKETFTIEQIAKRTQLPVAHVSAVMKDDYFKWSYNIMGVYEEKVSRYRLNTSERRDVCYESKTIRHATNNTQMPPSRLKEKIIKALEENPQGLTLNELESILGVEKKTFQVYVYNMFAIGVKQQIQRLRSGRRGRNVPPTIYYPLGVKIPSIHPAMKEKSDEKE